MLNLNEEFIWNMPQKWADVKKNDKINQDEI
jgi:hypothetical protein